MARDDIYQQSLELHQRLGGKLEVGFNFKIKNTEDLSLVYSPGVAAVSKAIADDPAKAYDYTIKRNTVAIVSDGSAVLGLGNIGAEAAIPVMEGKAMLFKNFADIDAFPICLTTQNSYEIVSIVKNIAPVFGGINLEDIAAPRSFEVEQALQDIGIPVFHDDQHGTAIVTLAALINAAKLKGKPVEDLKVVINGSGAAGVAIAELLLCVGQDADVCNPVKELLVCDSKGILNQHRTDLVNSTSKLRLAAMTNQANTSGKLADAVQGADVFIGVSVGGVLTQDMVRNMAPDPIILAMANPTPEIWPEDAFEAGAMVVGTGRSDYPNQVNNVLAFPGIFRGALNARARRITNRMKITAAYALAEMVKRPSAEMVIPSALDRSVAYKVADAVEETCQRDQADLDAGEAEG